jgi:hypothetical protein
VHTNTKLAKISAVTKYAVAKKMFALVFTQTNFSAMAWC